jgi:predicted dehydrogenase
MTKSLHVAVVGLGFGREFAPIYRSHPAVGRVTLCDADSRVLEQVQAELGLAGGCGSLKEVLADASIDAVHLLTPLPLHAEQTEQVLEAGKHCACAVTMGLELDDLVRVSAAAKNNNRRYMMMETGAYLREFFFAKEMLDAGELGNINFARGDYYQDLEATYPAYWRNIPPMKYSSHSVGPILKLLNTRAISVSCVGAGHVRPDINQDPKCPFPIQVAHFKLADSDAIVQINRAWYQVAHAFTESFSVFGEKRGFEWSQLESEDHVVHTLAPPQTEIRWREIEARRVPIPFRPDLLPPELAPFAEGGHSGSHPHLVHEFVSSIVEERPSAINEDVAANWTAAGICAHESSLRGGEWVEIPKF